MITLLEAFFAFGLLAFLLLGLFFAAGLFFCIRSAWVISTPSHE